MARRTVSISDQFQTPEFREIASILNANPAAMDEQSKEQLKILKERLRTQRNEEFFIGMDLSYMRKEQKLAKLLSFYKEEMRRTWEYDEARFKAMEQQRKAMAQPINQPSTPGLDNTTSLTDLLLAEDQLKKVTDSVTHLQSLVFLRWQNAIKNAAQVAMLKIVARLDSLLAASAVPAMFEELTEADKTVFTVRHDLHRERMKEHIFEELSTRAAPDEMIENIPGFWEGLVEQCKEPVDEDTVKAAFSNVVNPVYRLNAGISMRNHINTYMTEEEQLYRDYGWEVPSSRGQDDFLQDVIDEYVAGITAAYYERMELRTRLYELQREREQETARFLALVDRCTSPQMKPSPYSTSRRPIHEDEEEEQRNTFRNS